MHKEAALFSVSVEMCVPFFDVDPMEIVWHGHYIKYFEIARCALLEKLSYDYAEMKKSGYAWPVVDIRVKYVRSLRFQQEFIVEASLVEIDARLKINYLITDKKTGEKLCKAYSVQVAVDLRTKEMCFASPSVLIDKVNQYLVGLKK